jgi:hypothetical protein
VWQVERDEQPRHSVRGCVSSQDGQRFAVCRASGE